MENPFYLQKGNIYALPVLHYNMEFAAYACELVSHLKPACVAVELADTMQLQLLHASSRLPDITLVSSETSLGERIYYLVEPCDALYETLRSALEMQIPAFCIDLDLDDYPLVREPFPDPYAIHKIGFKKYYELYKETVLDKIQARTEQDYQRELHMAKKLKELSLLHDSVLFIGGMFHVESVLKLLDTPQFPTFHSMTRDLVEMSTPTEESLRNIMGEFGWLSSHYEEQREQIKSDSSSFTVDRQKLIYKLFKESGKEYTESTGAPFPGYHLRNVMKFSRNYALLSDRLLPDLFQIVTAAKGCVDHNYAYEVWAKATEYPFHRNVDNLPEEDVDVEEIWGHSKLIQFHLKEPSRKGFQDFSKRKDKTKFKLFPPGPFSICSYPPEDISVENFGKFLQKKGTQILSEEAARTIPFTTSLEDGIDTKETIRHFAEKKLFVKTKGKPPGGVGSVVVVFDEDMPEEGKAYTEKFPWHTTWIGEHTQESDMAFYSTHVQNNVVGPGISKCEYGGFMMSYPPRRLYDIWRDPDYEQCRTKSEVLLAAAIDYSLKPVIVYVASKPPRSFFKNFARRFGKKIAYIPIGQLSPTTINKLRTFHVLDSHDKRDIAGEYIY